MKLSQKTLAVLSTAGLLVGTAAQAAVNPSSKSEALNAVEAVIAYPQGSAEQKLDYIKRLIEQEKLSQAVSGSQEEGRVEMAGMKMTCGTYNL